MRFRIYMLMAILGMVLSTGTATPSKSYSDESTIVCKTEHVAPVVIELHKEFVASVFAFSIKAFRAIEKRGLEKVYLCSLDGIGTINSRGSPNKLNLVATITGYNLSHKRPSENKTYLTAYRHIDPGTC